MQIRPFQIGNEAQVIALWERCNLVVPWNDPRADIALKLQVQPELFLVATHNDCVVGTVMAGYEGHRGWLNYLAVAPDVQGRGVGRRLVDAATDALRELGCAKINF